MLLSKIKMQTIGLLGTFVISSSSICMASPFQSIQNDIGTDKVAHFGAGYVITDVLEHTTKLERFAIVTGIAMAKESTDTQWDTNDILATCLGSLSANMLHGKF